MYMTMSSIRPNRVEVVTSVQRRRRWTQEQKLVKSLNKLMKLVVPCCWFPERYGKMIGHIDGDALLTFGLKFVQQ